MSVTVAVVRTDRAQVSHLAQLTDIAQELKAARQGHRRERARGRAPPQARPGPAPSGTRPRTERWAGTTRTRDRRRPSFGCGRSSTGPPRAAEAEEGPASPPRRRPRPRRRRRRRPRRRRRWRPSSSAAAGGGRAHRPRASASAGSTSPRSRRTACARARLHRILEGIARINTGLDVDVLLDPHRRDGEREPGLPRRARPRPRARRRTGCGPAPSPAWTRPAGRRWRPPTCSWTSSARGCGRSSASAAPTSSATGTRSTGQLPTGYQARPRPARGVRVARAGRADHPAAEPRRRAGRLLLGGRPGGPDGALDRDHRAARAARQPRGRWPSRTPASTASWSSQARQLQESGRAGPGAVRHQGQLPLDHLPRAAHAHHGDPGVPRHPALGRRRSEIPAGPPAPLPRGHERGDPAADPAGRVHARPEPARFGGGPAGALPDRLRGHRPGHRPPAGPRGGGRVR